MASKVPMLYDDDGNDTELPFKWEICSRCNGLNVALVTSNRLRTRIGRKLIAE